MRTIKFKILTCIQNVKPTAPQSNPYSKKPRLRTAAATRAAAGAAEPAWLVILLLLLAEVTDYLDGRAARRALRAAGSAALPGSGRDASFGATFDMEVDAFVTGARALQAPPPAPTAAPFTPATTGTGSSRTARKRL